MLFRLHVPLKLVKSHHNLQSVSSLEVEFKRDFSTLWEGFVDCRFTCVEVQVNLF